MNSHNGLGVLLRMVLCATVLLLGGCFSRKPAETTPDPTPPPAPVPAEPEIDVEALYFQLDVSLDEYDEGIELIAAGEEILGEQRLASAEHRLDAAARECAGADACDFDRFFDAYDLVLNRHEIALKQQAYRIETLEASAQADLEREPGTSEFSAAMPESDTHISMLRGNELKGTELREIIELNGPVNAALDDWLTWMRPLLMESYENYMFLRDTMAPVYEEAGLPEALLFAMIATETGGKVHAYSRAGAAGPLQFMRHTGRRYGLGMDDGFDMRLDPESATRANVGYLNDQLDMFDNSLEKALAAYNGGENRVRSVNRRLKNVSFWDSRFYYSLPRETREYVPRILAAAWLFMHPEDYNLSFPELDTRVMQLVVDEEIALGELTICLGQVENAEGWFRILRNLNPRLTPGDRIEAGTEIQFPEALVESYEEHCLGGEHVARARVLHDANYSDEPEMVPYTVRRGDTLGRIARRFQCVSIQELAEINNIRAPRYMIRVGQELKVPNCA